MSGSSVLRVNAAEEQALYLEAVAEIIRRVQSEHKVTLLEIAERIDVTITTISNAANKKSGLGPTYLKRIGQAFGAHNLDPYAALAGARMVPLPTDGEKDVLPFLATATLKIVRARDPSGPSGCRETHTEQADYLPDLRALRRELDLLIARIEERLAA